MRFTPNVVTVDKMKVGRKGSGKHWTKAEVESREKAAERLKRKSGVVLEPPQWVLDDTPTLSLWNKIVGDAGAFDDLLDNLDAHTLATYCKLEVEKERAVLSKDVKSFESLSRLSLQYAKSLGLTPEGRARLASKRANKDGEQSDGYI